MTNSKMINEMKLALLFENSVMGCSPNETKWAMGVRHACTVYFESEGHKVEIATSGKVFTSFSLIKEDCKLTYYL